MVAVFVMYRYIPALPQNNQESFARRYSHSVCSTDYLVGCRVTCVVHVGRICSSRWAVSLTVQVYEHTLRDSTAIFGYMFGVSFVLMVLIAGHLN